MEEKEETYQSLRNWNGVMSFNWSWIHARNTHTERPAACSWTCMHPAPIISYKKKILKKCSLVNFDHIICWKLCFLVIFALPWSSLLCTCSNCIVLQFIPLPPPPFSLVLLITLMDSSSVLLTFICLTIKENKWDYFEEIHTSWLPEEIVAYTL